MPPGGAAVYIYIVDPVIKGADYAVATILPRHHDDEQAALLKQYLTRTRRPEFVNLSLIAELGK